MAVSGSPSRSAKRIASPQIESQKQKKTKKGKRREMTESEPNPSDLTQPDEAPPQPSAPSSPPRKRTKSPGVRVVGGRIYDSENGKTCHQVSIFFLKIESLLIREIGSMFNRFNGRSVGKRPWISLLHVRGKGITSHAQLSSVTNVF